MFKATYLGKPGSRVRIVHEIGTYQFEGGTEQDVPNEVGKYLRHISKIGELDPGFHTIDIDNLMLQYGVDPSKIEVKGLKKKKKKPVEIDKERLKLKRIKRKMREA